MSSEGSDLMLNNLRLESHGYGRTDDDSRHLRLRYVAQIESPGVEEQDVVLYPGLSGLLSQGFRDHVLLKEVRPGQHRHYRMNVNQSY